MTESAHDTLVDGRYRILDRIGSGGMADVFSAMDLQLGRKVALKVLYQRFAEDREFVERFRREASSAAGLQHQNVVSVYDRGAWNGTYYIAMEYLEGHSLKALIERDAPLDPRRAIDLTLQILRAARFAHRRGIIHRDLKPQNVIVDDEDRLKVTDFGIARAGASDMTQTGSIMGTAQYLSPEQAQGHAVSAQSDLYSIGIILYELLTGRVPFEGESAVSIALKQVNERPIPPSAYNAGVTRDLESVVLRALEKDPARRFADADAFIAALEAVRARLPEDAVAIPVTDPPAVAEPVPDAYASYGEEPPPKERSGWRRWWWVAALVLFVAAIIAVALLRNGGGGSPSPAKVTVPGVVGTQRAAAQARLQQAGLRSQVVRRTSSKPVNQVLAQDPKAGAEAEDNSVVTLTVSRGPAQVKVPSGLVGLSETAATNRLEAEGFRVKTTDASSSSVTQGNVISVAPAEGTRLDKGSTVTLTVSTGAPLVAVPGVTGNDADRATSTLENAGFKVVRTEQESTRSAGTVLSQSPAGGSQAAKGATVTLTVAKAAPRVTVTDVTGETTAVGRQRLQSEGFQVNQRTRQVDSPEGDDVILEQNPGGGKAPKGSTVTITVGKFNASTAPGASTTGGATPGSTTTTP
jgi:beta-lactam-binding protein with PASTA domain/tRNA A-37 threonylcarbamoyl transferase component Bud32